MHEDFNDWTEAFNFIRHRFCERCDFTCNPDKRAFCMEQFLYIIENWEVARDLRSPK